MSRQTFANTLLYNLDHVINSKLGIILTNETINESYPSLKKLDYLEESLISSSLQLNKYNELPRESLVEVLSLMKAENTELANLLNQVNKERKELKQHNFQLIERLFSFENFCIENFDKDFNRFLSKTMFVNYEISKIFLEKERENTEKMQEIMNAKDEEILNLKTKISMLEQRVIESRNMLKKTLLETSPLKQKNENTPIKNDLDLQTRISMEMNKHLYRPRESPQKTSSPTSQQDTTSDSLARTFPAALQTLEDNNSGENDLLAKTQGKLMSSPIPSVSRNKILEASPAKGLKKDVKPTVPPKINSITKPTASSMNQMKTQQKDTLKVGPGSQVPTPSSRNSAKKDLATNNIKSPSNKINESQSKFKFKPEELLQGADPENLTLSFLLDQNVSADSINLQMPSSSSTIKELENELKKRDVTLSTNQSKIEGKYKTSVVPCGNKSTHDASKVKPKITINSSPIPVKKRNQTENK